VNENVVTITGEHLSADISLLGAELRALRDAEGRDLLWNGDPAYWTGRAPVLFPIVGTLRNDRYSVGARSYTLPRHGFARRRMFGFVSGDETHAVFRLMHDPDTLAVYPFEFRLDISFAIHGHRLSVEAVVTNTGEEALPASFGFHPAFRWPLPYGAPREEHRLLFDMEERGPLRRLDASGLFVATPLPSPVEGRTLRLRDDLFAADALVFTELEGRGVDYGAPEGPQLRLHYPDTPHLGVWSRPGAPFVCIEPWQGYSDPAGFAGGIWDKPGIVRISPGEHRGWRMDVLLIA